MTRPTIGSLDRRIDRLEQRSQIGPLSAAERVELDQLEREYASAFPRPVDEMTDGEIEGLLAYHRSAAAGRYCQLKDRARTPEEIARSKERAAAIDAMTDEEVDAYLAGQACLRPSEIGR